ncbi:MAG TPA: DUF4169 family protein [Fontimonas sp.]
MNLRTFRKRKAREDAAAAAAENRVRHGRSKAQKEQDALEAALAEQRLDALRREHDDTAE